MNSTKSNNFHLYKIICRSIKWYSSEKKLPTIQELKKQRSKLLGVDHGYQPTPVDRSHLLKYVPKFETLPPRNIKDSFLEGIIPLSTDEILQEKYITFLGRVRIGRLLEDMDIFAGLLLFPGPTLNLPVVILSVFFVSGSLKAMDEGYKYIYAPTVPKDVSSPFILVTAHCDRIDYTSYQRRHNQDIKISGFVSWVGKSSMEVVVKLEQYFEGKWHKITRAFFLMVARNATGTQSVAINPLKPSNDTERQIIEDGEARKVKRSNISTTHISQTLPTLEEQKLIHNLYMDIRKQKRGDAYDKYTKNFVVMDKCRVSNIIFCQPEDRNFYNTIFGGFIMRHATELAWVLGYQFFRHRPAIKHISDISFHRPIAVNALLQMFARVVYTQDLYAQLIITAVASDPTKGESTVTNTFHFTLKSSEPVKQVYPKSYHEAMLYIDGIRHFKMNLEERVVEANDTLDEYMVKLSHSST